MDTNKGTPDKVHTTPNSSYNKLNDDHSKKSNFLTPCRRIGLGKSPRSIVKSPLMSNNQKEIVSPLIKKLKSEINNDLTKPCKVNNFCISDELSPTKPLEKENPDKSNLTNTNHSLNKTQDPLDSRPQENVDDSDVQVTREMLMELALQIKEKQEKIKNHYSMNIPSDLLALDESINVWREAGQSALQCLLKISQERACPTTMLQLIQAHGFDSKLLHYNDEDDDFI